MERAGPVSPKEYSTFIFDLDGTLFTLPVDWGSVRREVESLTGKKLDSSPLFQQVRGILNLRPDLRSQVFSTIDSLEAKAQGDARPMTGAIEALQALSDRAKLALVTMQGKALVDTLAMKFGLADFFAVMLTREDSLDRAEQIGSALAATRSHANDSLFVGDRPADVLAARQAGIEVAILGRAGTAPEPDYAFLNYREFTDYFL